MGASKGPAAGVLNGSVFSYSPNPLNQQFCGRVYGWKRGTKIPLIDRSGRGGPRWSQTRRLNIGSSISFRMQGNGEAYPAPIGMQNALGTVVIQFDVGKQVTLVGEITDYSESFDQPKQGEGSGGQEWDIGVSMNLSQPPTYAGWPSSGTNGQMTPATQLFLDQETDQGLHKNKDPHFINNRARRRWDVGTIADTNAAEVSAMSHFLTSAAPMSGLVARTANLDRTDRAGVAVVVEYGTKSTVQDITMPATHSEGSGWVFTDAFATIIDSTDTDANVRNTQFALYQGTPYFDHLTVTSINPYQKRLVVYYKNIGTLVEFVSGEPAGRWLPAILDSGVYKVYLQVQKITSTLALIQHRSLFYKTKVRRRFTLSRFIATTPPVPDHANLAGTVNNATFLGLAAGTVMFLRTRGKANVGLAGNIPMFLSYEFECDDAGFYDYQGYKDDVFQSRVASLTGGFGLYAASLFATEKSIVVTAPSQSDFSVFLP